MAAVMRRLTALAAAVFATVPATGLTAGQGGGADADGGAHRRDIGRGQIRFDGHGPEWWAARYRRERAKTHRLVRLMAARLDRVVWIVNAFQCIHSYEGSWSANTGNGYYGGLQFGYGEWRRFGGQFAPRADMASPAEQIAAGIAYHSVAGFGPWPLTARRCGLR